MRTRASTMLARLMAYKKKKRLLKDDVASAVLYVRASGNNVIATCADGAGNVLAWTSAGERGFKGVKKASPFAAQMVIEAIVKKASVFKVRNLEVEVSGITSNRDAALRSLQTSDLTIISIRDVTPVAHNGCRPPKARRV